MDVACFFFFCIFTFLSLAFFYVTSPIDQFKVITGGQNHIKFFQLKQFVIDARPKDRRKYVSDGNDAPVVCSFEPKG